MNAMNRRAFLGRSTAMVAASILPIPKAMALVAPDRPPLHWFAVGTEEYLYPYLAESIEEAARQYAHEFGHTKGDACPECDEPSCAEHLDPKEWDDPLPWIDEFGFKFDDTVPVDRDPTTIEWLKHGCNVPCDGCDYGEPDECYEFEGKALCCECLEVAKTAKLDDIIGNGYPTMFQGASLHG